MRWLGTVLSIEGAEWRGAQVTPSQSLPRSSKQQSACLSPWLATHSTEAQGHPVTSANYRGTGCPSSNVSQRS
jgi:hypothetical protein